MILEIEPLAEIEFPPVEAWLVGVGDAWLDERVARLRRIGGAWGAVSAAALVGCYSEPGRGLAVGFAEALVAGRDVPFLSEPRKWLASLTPAQYRTAEDLALAETGMLCGQAEDVRDQQDLAWLIQDRVTLDAMAGLLKSERLSACLHTPDWWAAEAVRRIGGATGTEWSNRAWLRYPLNPPWFAISLWGPDGDEPRG